MKILYLITLLLPFISSAMPEQALWEKGVTELKESHIQEAIQSLSQWILEAEKVGVRSPEAHYNLGIANWAAEDTEHAMTELLKAADLRNYPWQSWSDFDSMGLIQREIGLVDNPADSLPVRTGAAFSRNLFLLLFFGGLWSLCVFAVVRKKPIGRAFGPLLLLITFSCCLAIGIGATAIRSTGVLRIVAKGDTPSLLLPIPQNMEAAESLMELPPGTLLLTDSISGEYLHVKAPVPGWIHQDNLSTG